MLMGRRVLFSAGWSRGEMYYTASDGEDVPAVCRSGERRGESRHLRRDRAASPVQIPGDEAQKVATSILPRGRHFPGESTAQPRSISWRGGQVCSFATRILLPHAQGAGSSGNPKEVKGEGEQRGTVVFATRLDVKKTDPQRKVLRFRAAISSCSAAMQSASEPCGRSMAKPQEEQAGWGSNWRRPLRVWARRSSSVLWSSRRAARNRPTLAMRTGISYRVARRSPCSNVGHTTIV